MSNKIFAGVGSRKTPAEFNFFCYLVGERLGRAGYALDSGDCHGPDRAFYAGMMKAYSERYIVPSCRIWRGWNTHNSGLLYLNEIMRPQDFYLFTDTSQATQDYCRNRLFQVKPHLKDKWNKTNPRTGRPYYGPGAKNLLMRDVLQVEGPCPDQEIQTPEFVLAYAPVVNGEPQGGTATAIKIAELNGVPVYNFFYEENRRRIAAWLGIDYDVDFLECWAANGAGLSMKFSSENIQLAR